MKLWNSGDVIQMKMGHKELTLMVVVYRGGYCLLRLDTGRFLMESNNPIRVSSSEGLMAKVDELAKHGVEYQYIPRGKVNISW